MEVNNDNMQRLDVDLLEDLVEATGNIIHDREAKAALNKLLTNQLEKHTLESVIKWGKERQRLRRQVRNCAELRGAKRRAENPFVMRRRDVAT